MRRKADACAITLNREGYRPATITLERHWSGWVWGNLLLGDGFLVGSAIDLADGAFWRQAPAKVKVNLATESASK